MQFLSGDRWKSGAENIDGWIACPTRVKTVVLTRHAATPIWQSPEGDAELLQNVFEDYLLAASLCLKDGPLLWENLLRRFQRNGKYLALLRFNSVFINSDPKAFYAWRLRSQLLASHEFVSQWARSDARDTEGARSPKTTSPAYPLTEQADADVFDVSAVGEEGVCSEQDFMSMHLKLKPFSTNLTRHLVQLTIHTDSPKWFEWGVKESGRRPKDRGLFIAVLRSAGDCPDRLAALSETLSFFQRHALLEREELDYRRSLLSQQKHTDDDTNDDKVQECYA